MTSVGLRQPRPMPQADGLRPGEEAFVHPPMILQQRAEAPPKEQNIIRDLLQRLRQQPTPADEPAPEPQKEKPMQSVLRK